MAELVVMALPNLDISDLLTLGWGALQWVVAWSVVIFLLVFSLTVLVGMADLMAEHFSAYRQRRAEGRKGRRGRE